MTSAPTDNRPRRQDRQAPPRSTDPVPAHLRKWRALWTFASLIGSAGGMFWAALALGTGNQGELYAALFLILLGIVSATVAQRPGWYTGQAVLPAWMRRTREVADQDAPRQRVRPAPRPRTRPAATTPTVPTGPRPAPELGENFTYIVLLVRRMIEKRRTDEFAVMERFYAGIDWDDEIDSDDTHPYRAAVELVRNIATEWPAFVPRDHANFDGRELRNPEVFLAELDDVSEAAAAVAALMLVRDDDDVTDDVFNLVMTPWMQARLPYRQDNIRYQWMPAENGYRPIEIQGAAPPIPKLVTPEDVLAQQAEQAPPAPTPAPRPATRPAPRPAPEPAQAPAPAAVDLDDESGYGFSVNQLVHATELVVTSQFGSTAMIGRKLRLGFAACGRIVNRLVELGILDTEDTDSGRAVLAQPSQLSEAKRYVVEMELERRSR